MYHIFELADSFENKATMNNCGMILRTCIDTPGAGVAVIPVMEYVILELSVFASSSSIALNMATAKPGCCSSSGELIGVTKREYYSGL